MCHSTACRVQHCDCFFSFDYVCLKIFRLLILPELTKGKFNVLHHCFDIKHQKRSRYTFCTLYLHFQNIAGTDENCLNADGFTSKSQNG